MGVQLRLQWTVLLVVASLSIQAKGLDLDSWLAQVREISVRNMMQNVGAPGTAPGSVVASPSKEHPDYFRHWIRDAALTMNVVISLYENAKNADEKTYYRNILMQYVDFSRRNQTTDNFSGGLGEPLFYADGSAFTKGWGRPQNDGPAIRGFVLSRLAHIFLNEGMESYVKQKMYNGQIPAYTVIKADLEYVAHHWQESCFDLWEEVKGHHFYTRMVQRKALIDGAAIAERMKDYDAAKYYREQASLLEEKINSHWHWTDKLLMTTLGRDGGVDYKYSNLDSATILGVLHGDTHDGFMPVYDDRVLATAIKIKDTFKNLYSINKKGPGVAIGRYPEDTYDGYVTGATGNPWVLLTNGFAEYYYRVSKGLRSKGEIKFNDVNIDFFKSLGAGQVVIGQSTRAGSPLFNQILSNLNQTGDDFLKRVQYHTGEDGRLDEQMNRENGYMQGAKNLTWSCASLIVANWERN